MGWVAPGCAQPHVKAPVPSSKCLTACDAAGHPGQAGVQHTCIQNKHPHMYTQTGQVDGQILKKSCAVPHKAEFLTLYTSRTQVMPSVLLLLLAGM